MQCFRSRKHRAFTLIEFRIVVAIIAILAAILIPNFLHACAAALSSSCEGKLRDGDNHATMTLTQLSDYTPGVTGIRWCSSSGLHACVC